MTRPERGKKPIEKGIVVGAGKMQKTITVERTRLVKHARYGKYLKRRKRFPVHDETGKARVGDVVEFIESKPISKRKRWRLLSVISQGRPELAPLPDLEEGGAR